jgi:hypothetical protein
MKWAGPAALRGLGSVGWIRFDSYLVFGIKKAAPSMAMNLPG